MTAINQVSARTLSSILNVFIEEDNLHIFKNQKLNTV